MRHAKNNQRLSRPSDQRQALLHGMMKSLIQHGRITTTLARAREGARLADRLVSLGKEGSVHSRRRALMILQNRTLVKQLFADIAPRFGGVGGGYTRVIRLGLRPGDGAQLAQLAFSRIPVAPSSAPAGAKAAQKPQPAAGPKAPPPQAPQESEKPKGFFEGLRHLWTHKKKGSGAA